ncbi:MAG: permease-like cell division protein FtsX [Synergistaceae bacterium]
MSSFRYVLRDGVRLVVRHAGMSFLTIFTAMTVFFIIGSSALFLLNMKNIVKSLEDQVSISAYVNENADVNAISKQARAIPYVKEVNIITKEMALEKLRSRIGSQSKAVMLLGENPLPVSIEVRVKKSSYVADVARDLISIKEINDIVYPGHLAEKLTKVSGFLEKFALILLIISIATSSIVLFNTIKISVYSREEEINVMLRVGATTTYVAMPFIIQGFILGILGTVLSSILIGFFYYSAIDKIKDMLPFLPLIDSPRICLKLAFMLISAGTTLSLISSLFAVDGFVRKAMKPV